MWRKMKHKRRGPSGRRLVMGKHCLYELYEHARERILKVYTARRDDGFVDKLQSSGIVVKFVDKMELSRFVDSDSHQLFVAEVKEKQRPNLVDFLEGDNQGLVLMLDSIFDPQNLGALLRAAECFGASGVVWSKNRGAPMTPIVSKASVGASELVNIFEVSNLAETVRKFQDYGYEAVTAEIDDAASSLYDFVFPEKILLVMGSEGKGVQRLISKRADHKVYIPMFGKIDSLNVSQATAVFLSYWKRGVLLGELQ